MTTSRSITDFRSSRPARRGRIARIALAGLGATTGMLALSPGIAHATTPDVRVVAAQCDSGVWTVSWNVDNVDSTDPTPMTINTASTTGAATDSLSFATNPVPTGFSTLAIETFAATATAVVTAHVNYNHPALPAVNITGSWTVGSPAGGVIIEDNCNPAPTVSLDASPSSRHPGDITQVSGQCQPDSAGFALSSAFVHDATHDFAGQPAVPFTTDHTGHFSVPATIASTTAVGHFDVTLRCGGGLVPVSAPLDVIAANPTVTGPTATITNPDTPVRETPSFTG